MPNERHAVRFHESARRMIPPLHYSLAALMALLAGCASVPHKVDLDFLEQPSVTRDQVESQWGPPSATFEDDLVLSYRLSQKKTGYVLAQQCQYCKWKGVSNDLILAFDDTGILKQHRLIPMLAPNEAH